mmetsp:Transcript_126225/g.288932  ORF Transcript_126225/g.288932 Transcript_126225/m.288932 type:complete len:136 (+) Transcript_126225:406-813(+)
MHVAAFNGCTAAIQRLVSSGADIDIARSSADGPTPLICAAEQDHEEACDRLAVLKADLDTLAAATGRNAIMAAVERGSDAALRSLLRSGADPTICSPVDGLSALTMAERCGTSTARRLVAAYGRRPDPKVSRLFG